MAAVLGMRKTVFYVITLQSTRSIEVRSKVTGMQANGSGKAGGR
jgi:hypothetical protein